MGAWFVKLSQTSAVGHLLSGSPQPVDRLSGLCVHGASIPAICAGVKLCAWLLAIAAGSRSYGFAIGTTIAAGSRSYGLAIGTVGAASSRD